MHFRASLFPFLIFIVLTSCVSHEESETQTDVGRYGFDYSSMKRRAATDVTALRGFFVFRSMVDGAAAEAYAEDLQDLFRLVGEDHFLEAIDSMHSEEIRSYVLRFLDCNPKFARDGLHLAPRFPQLSALLDRERGWRRAPLGDDGKAIALTVQYEDRRERVPATGDYAILTIWTPREKAFYLFETRSKRVLATRDFEGFLRGLNRVPSNSLMVWIDTCTVSRSWAMPDSCRSRLDDTRIRMKERGITWAEPTIACVCESKGATFPPID